jgi:hypothetical protein
MQYSRDHSNIEPDYQYSNTESYFSSISTDRSEDFEPEQTTDQELKETLKEL